MKKLYSVTVGRSVEFTVVVYAEDPEEAQAIAGEAADDDADSHEAAWDIDRPREVKSEADVAPAWLDSLPHGEPVVRRGKELTVRRILAGIPPEPSGLCSAHHDGEDLGCKVCYPTPEVKDVWTEEMFPEER